MGLTGCSGPGGHKGWGVLGSVLAAVSPLLTVYLKPKEVHLHT